MPALLSISEAAKFLGVAPVTLRLWERQGKISSIRTAGGQRRYDPENLKQIKLGNFGGQEQLLNISEAAKVMGVAPVTLRLWERQGKISSIRTAGGQRRYRREEIGTPHVPVDVPISPIFSPEPVSYAPNYTLPLSYAQNTVLAGVLVVLVIFISAFALKTPIASQIKGLAGNIAGKLGYTSPTVPLLSQEREAGRGSVLASQTTLNDLLFNVNVNAKFAKDLEVLGKIKGPNILYSVVAGPGVIVTGDPQNPIISATASAAFASIKTGSTKLIATGAGDLITFTPGTGISISGSTTTNTLTISANGSDLNVSGWVDDGAIVRLTTSGDLVDIGTASGSAKLAINSDTSIDLFTASRSGNLLAKLDTNGLFNLAATGFTAGLKLQNSSTLFSGSGIPANSSGNNGDYYFRSDGTTSGTTVYFKASGAWITAGSSEWQRLAGALSPGNITDDVLVGGTATASAKFQISGTTGRISSSIIPSATSTYDIGTASLTWRNIYADNVFSGTTGTSGFWQRNAGALSPSNITDDILVGATATGSARLVLAGTPSGSGALDIALTSTAKIKTTYLQLTNGSATGYLLTSDSVGNASWTNSSATGSFGAWTLTGTTVYPNQTNYNLLLGSTVTTDVVGKFTVIGDNAGKALATFNYTGTDQNILVASQAGVTKFVLSGLGTTPVASISAQTSFAALVVDNKGVGDLFTASSSGLNRFVITQNGNVGVGTTLPTALLTVQKDNIVTTSTDGILLQNTTPSTVSVTAQYSPRLRIVGQGWKSNATAANQQTEWYLENQPFSRGVAPDNSLVFQSVRNGSNGGVISFCQTDISNATFILLDGVVGRCDTTVGFTGIGTSTTVTTNVIGFYNNATQNGNFNVNGVGLGAAKQLMWFSGTANNATSGDLGITRNAAGVLEVNNGPNGTLATLVAKNIGVNTTSLLAGLDVRGSSGTIAVASVSGSTSFAALVTNNDGVGDLFTASQSGWTRFVIAGDGSITQNANTTTGTAYKLNANLLSTGNGFYGFSSSTALSTGRLGYFSWEPTAAATASGNLFNINLGNGADTTGNIFAVTQNNSNLFTVSETTVTSSLPAAFNAAGDVSLAYDLIFTNPTASYIKSSAPLYIQAGPTYANNDLTLQTYGTGAVNIPQSIATTGSPTALRVTGGAHTTLTASAEAVDVNFNLARTVQFSTGALTTQRAFLIQAPTYGFVGASTITNAATLAITGAPIAGTNATITNPAALVVQSGKTGLGTASPLATLHVSDTQTATATAMITNTNTAAGIKGLAVQLYSTTLDTTSRFVNFLDKSGIIIGKINAANTTTVAYSANGVDFAEYFIKDSAVYEPGDIVSESGSDLTKSKNAYDSKIVGIVSNTASFVGGVEGDNKVLVALMGQVPIKIASSSQAIHKGDFVTSSVVAGKAIKATKPGFVVGKALEDWSPGGADKILVYLNVIWADPNAAMAFDEAGNLSVNNISLTDTTNNVANLGASLLRLESGVASLSAQLADLKIQIDPAATLSAQLWQVATASGKLTTALSVRVPELNVTGKLTVGLLTFDDIEASITSLTGEITVKGDLAVTGKIRVLGDSIGRAIIPTGLTELVVSTAAVSTSSSVFVTPINSPLAVSAQSTQSGKFVIRIPVVQSNDLKVNWWIVN